LPHCGRKDDPGAPTVAIGATGKIPAGFVIESAMAANYESEITKFIRDLKAKSPEIERNQREGRAIYWDKRLDPDELRRWEESNVPQQPYVYQTRN
jgi:hypothetical protein